jgi:small GTP-binding protein
MKKNTCKVCVVGESGVGKTSIIKRYISDEFDPNNVSTDGANYASKDIEYEEYKKKLVMDIWDTAGQERYRGLGGIFYKDTSIAILVYDITQEKSFQEIKDYWYQQVKDNSMPNTSKKILY